MTYYFDDRWILKAQHVDVLEFTKYTCKTYTGSVVRADFYDNRLRSVTITKMRDMRTFSPVDDTLIELFEAQHGEMFDGVLYFGIGEPYSTVLRFYRILSTGLTQEFLPCSFYRLSGLPGEGNILDSILEDL